MKLYIKKTIVHSLLISLFAGACTRENMPITITPDDFHKAVDKVTEIMVHDIFSPPVASRIYVYPNIAAYEIIAKESENFTSLAGQLSQMGGIPDPDTETTPNYRLAALIAHLEVSKMLIFSEHEIEHYRDSLYQKWEKVNKKELQVSRAYALKVASYVQKWLDTDQYKQTRTMPKFTVNADEPSRWQPTPPAYMDGIEPHWNKIRPFTLDSASQFKPVPPPDFSMEKNSAFYKELQEVYKVSLDITEKGDDSEEIEIAQFWDCNPYVSVTRGHLMFATKKITPGAHWIGICKIAARKSGANFNETVYAYTKTSIAIADAFISCWDEKYRSNLIRPETLINTHFDEEWKPILQTPPFPEYTSGHSVVSGAASVVLTSVFGENFAFDDDTEVPYGLPIRSFDSFKEAADEAAISRLYGGIHYRAAIEEGVSQGRSLGKFVVNKLKMKAFEEKVAIK
ncbi:vanadium-dependent haloperoxidase [Ascidiimonas aurantiaca]|uniref:vanadium-dependent haloperoxidase n=1 Tax=Ascidiimonas aurantiaca TaxID=1685432 RepID=UPI0030EF098A